MSIILSSEWVAFSNGVAVDPPWEPLKQRGVLNRDSTHKSNRAPFCGWWRSRSYSPALVSTRGWESWSVAAAGHNLRTHADPVPQLRRCTSAPVRNRYNLLYISSRNLVLEIGTPASRSPIAKKKRPGIPSRFLPAQPCHFEQASRKGHPAHAIGDGAG